MLAIALSLDLSLALPVARQLRFLRCHITSGAPHTPRALLLVDRLTFALPPLSLCGDLRRELLLGVLLRTGPVRPLHLAQELVCDASEVARGLRPGDSDASGLVSTRAPIGAPFDQI